MEDDSKTSKKSKIIISTIMIVFAVVFIILVAQIAILIMNKGSIGQGAPDDAFRELVSAMNNGNLERVYGVSVYSLNMSYSEFETNYGEVQPGENVTISIRTLNVVNKDDLDVEQMSRMESIMPALEQVVGGQIDDYCMIEFTIKVTTSENGESQSEVNDGAMFAVLVDSKWYLVFPFEEGQVSTPAVSLSKTIVPEGVKISVVSISTSDVSWDDVHIIIQDGTNFANWFPNSTDLDGGMAVSYNYSDSMLGPIWVCCTVTDLAGNGMVNGGDFVVMTSYMNSMTFSTSTTYTVMLVYEPTDAMMGSMAFVG